MKTLIMSINYKKKKIEMFIKCINTIIPKMHMICIIIYYLTFTYIAI